MSTGLALVDGDSLLVSVLVVAVALVHLLPDELPVSSGRSRHSLLSAAGGVSIVYAFLHLFPELDGRRESLEGVDVLVGSLAGHHIYGLAFVGLALFYGLERLAAISRSHEFERDLGPFADEPVFWIHVGGFAVYNAFIGYVLVQGETGTESATLFAVAMALHLFGNDAAMEQHHRDVYRRIGRWVLAAAVLLGAGAGAVYALGDATLTILLGLLTGGIVFNAIKDELPRTQESRFWAFAVGAGGYGSILLLL
ncbi:hypothetical protein [Natronococcus sp.]|uniref:hypothetical protein n=1 Tax=Natronococcus sp. TaxID=35747 RepID=UPI003A4E38EB